MIQVVGGALFRENALLACRRAKGRKLEGFWEFPGGKIELGETPEAALKRELQEELGLTATVSKRISSIHDAQSDIGLQIFVVETDDDPQLSDAHDDLAWLTINQLSEVNWSPLDIPTVAYLGKNESKHYWGIN